jgi:hypothetical protein
VGLEGKTPVVHRHNGPRSEQLARERGLFGPHGRRQRAGRLLVGEIDDRTVDRGEDDVERSGTASHLPPGAVEDGVAEVQDAAATGLHNPRNLRIAEPVDGRQRNAR